MGAVPTQVEVIRKKTFEKLFEKMRHAKVMEIDRDRMLGRLSEEELKKLFRFEAGKKEKYKKYKVYGFWEK